MVKKIFAPVPGRCSRPCKDNIDTNSSGLGRDGDPLAAKIFGFFTSGRALNEFASGDGYADEVRAMSRH